jgi:hypothetical protein
VANWLFKISAGAIPQLINILGVRNPLLLITSLFLLTSNQDRSEERASSAAPIATLSSERAQSAYDFVNSIGANIHLNYFDRTYGNFQLVERELASIGIRHVRDGVHLMNADYDKAVYSRWSQLGDIGIRFDAVLDPRSALGPLTPDKLDQVDDLANHTIESFEGPNELDISNIPNWPSVARDYQEDIYRSTKSMTGGKSFAVIGPSFAFASKGSSVGNISDRIDYGNLHPYPAAKMPSTVFPDQPLLAENVSGSKKIFITESGYHNALNDHSDQAAVSETSAAKYIPRLFLENFSRGIPRTYLYEFMDEAPDPGLTNFQMHWGLVRSDGSEKPAFTAVKNLISELSDSAEPEHLQQLTYSLDAENAQIHHLLLQRSDGEFFLILWQEVQSYDYRKQQDIAISSQPVTLTLDHNVRNINTYEPAVQAQPLRVYAHATRILLDVPDHPLVVQITPQ